jgi:hypothetical protein
MHAIFWPAAVDVTLTIVALANVPESANIAGCKTTSKLQRKMYNILYKY